MTLKERGQTAFMVVKHAKAAVLSAQRGREVHAIDQLNLDYLDDIIQELYGYRRADGELRYQPENTPQEKSARSAF